MAEFDPDAFLAREDKKKSRGGFDPDAFLKKTEPESALQTFGRGAASTADSVLNAVSSLVEYANYPLQLAYRGTIQGKPLAQANEEAVAATALPKDIIGRASGVAGTSGYENAPLRAVGSKIGNVLSENVISPIAQQTGLPEEYVSNVLETATLGLGPPTKGAVGAVKPVVKGAVDVGKSTYQGFTNQIAKPGEVPAPGQRPSSLQPLGETYIPADTLQQWRSGKISTKQATESALPTTGPESPLPQAAVKRLGGQVPYAGEGVKAYGEMLGRGYRDPAVLGSELAADYFLAGVPTVAKMGVKGYQGYKGIQAARELEKSGFTRMTPKEMQALQTGDNIYGYQAPTANYSFTPPTGPAVPKGPAQTNAQALGITPPMTAAESGFTQQLAELTKKNSPPPLVRTTETTPTAVKTTEVVNAPVEAPSMAGPAIPETTGPAFEFAPKATPDWQGDWYKTNKPAGGRTPNMTNLVEALRSLPVDEMPASPQPGADILAQIRARGAKQSAPETSPAPVVTAEPVSGPAVPSVLNPELDSAPSIDMSRRLALKQQMESVPNQMATEAALAKRETRSTAQQARGDLVQDIKDYTNVTKQGNKLSYDKESFNELADSLGKKIDWSDAPDITNMPLKQGRKEIRKFVYGELKESGVKSPGKTMINDLFEEVPTSSTLQKNEMKSKSYLDEGLSSEELKLPEWKKDVLQEAKYSFDPTVWEKGGSPKFEGNDLITTNKNYLQETASDWNKYSNLKNFPKNETWIKHIEHYDKNGDLIGGSLIGKNYIIKENKNLDHTLEKVKSLFEEVPTSKPGTMSMMAKSSKQIPEEYVSKELSMAMLKGSGKWNKDGKAFEMTITPDGTKRLQVRDGGGKVIDERYLD